MKTVTALILLALVGVVLSKTAVHPRGCIYINRRCHRECEVGTQAYTIGCGYLTPEATCDEPNPKTDTQARICDYTACYCEPPTVRDIKTKKCVPLEECSEITV